MTSREKHGIFKPAKSPHFRGGVRTKHTPCSGAPARVAHGGVPGAGAAAGPLQLDSHSEEWRLMIADYLIIAIGVIFVNNFVLARFRNG